MPTVNVISTPEITGNILSCQTVLSVLNGSSRSSLWVSEDTGFATNNCTGQTEVFHSWSLTGFSILTIAFIGVILLIGITKLFSSFDSY